MPSKKTILLKIRELEKELIKLKSWCFEHYALDSQENKSSEVGSTLNRNPRKMSFNVTDNEDKTPDTPKGCGKEIQPIHGAFLYPPVKCGKDYHNAIIYCKECEKSTKAICARSSLGYENKGCECNGCKNLKSTKKGCGRKIYANDNIICGEWRNGDQHFCRDCFYSTLYEQSPQVTNNKVASVVSAPLSDKDINSQNKELLDKDYVKTNESVGGKK